MKKCLRCGQNYTDDSLNFCLSDGEFLVRATEFADTRTHDDSPPTLVMDQPRVTNPIDWPQSDPVQWQNHGLTPPAGQYGLAGYPRSLNTTLPTISLILGIISCLLVCCAGGIWLGLPAAIVGYIALRNVEGNPALYGGRGLAIGGMVLGIVTFFASVFFLIFGQLS
jgi:hypothetical protein